jgi:triosephosphate isomerase
MAEAVVGLSHVRVAICPPATLLHRLSQMFAGTSLITGGQDCHAERSGARTGDVSAEMLAEAGAKLVILGHSERRAGYQESDATIAAKLKAAVAAGLTPILCVGETRAERDAGATLSVLDDQLIAISRAKLSSAAFVIAYEPVWAIGGQASASTGQIELAHRRIRGRLQDLVAKGAAPAPILYGGAVSALSAREILATPEVGGLLVGGASLRAETFLPIIRAAAAHPG